MRGLRTTSNIWPRKTRNIDGFFLKRTPVYKLRSLLELSVKQKMFCSSRAHGNVLKEGFKLYVKCGKRDRQLPFQCRHRHRNTMILGKKAQNIFIIESTVEVLYIRVQFNATFRSILKIFFDYFPTPMTKHHYINERTQLAFSTLNIPSLSRSNIWSGSQASGVCFEFWCLLWDQLSFVFEFQFVFSNFNLCFEHLFV
jgi:hypothetical protein